MNMLYGTIIILLLAICYIYYTFNKQLKNEVDKLNKKINEIDRIEPKLTEKKQNVQSLEQPKNNEYNNLKEQYDNYVDSNNFRDVYEEDLSDNLKNEIDNLTLNKSFAEEQITNLDESLDNRDHMRVEEDVNTLDTVEGLDDDEVDVNTLDTVEGLDDDEVDVNTLDTVEGLDVDEKNNVYNEYSLEEINNLTVKELQDIARKNKLKIKGRKDELIERVKVLYNLNVI